MAPTFTSLNNATFAVDTQGTFTVSATGNPAPTLSEATTDTLPTGVTFIAATGVLSGTPTGNGGSFTLHFTATNVAGTVQDPTVNHFFNHGVPVL